MTETKYLGIDVGGTNIKTVVLNQQGNVLEQEKAATYGSTDKPDSWKRTILGLISSKTEIFSGGNQAQLRCGISAPGLVDDKNLQISHMPERLQGLERFNWSEELQRDITVINDAHSACVAEYESFYKDKIKNMLLLTLGTGVGGGAIISGALYQGSLQRAGHFGHITVDHNGKHTMTNMPGSLEYAIGNFSVTERTHGKFTTTRELVGAYREGDHLASYWWLSSVQKLAVGIASLINAFSPELVVLGGGLTEANDALFKPLGEFMALYEWRPGNHQIPITKAQYGGYAGAMGAAYFAKNITENKSTLP